MAELETRLRHRARPLGFLLRRLRGMSALKYAARVGLVGRGVFYLILAGLAVSLLLRTGGGAPEANANGALTQVARTALGAGALAAAAAGFAAFGLLRLAGAVTDDRHGRLRRASTAGQGLVYLGLALGTVTFLLGQRGTGSEGQQRRIVAAVLDVPGGRVLLALAGSVVLAVCAWQLIVAVRGHFADTLHTEQMSSQRRKVTRLVARVGIPARALAFTPGGVLLIVAAVRSDPRQAKGLDGLLDELTLSTWGRVVVLLVACGFVIFAAYSFLEARHRQISAGA